MCEPVTSCEVPATPSVRPPCSFDETVLKEDDPSSLSLASFLVLPIPVAADESPLPPSEEECCDCAWFLDLAGSTVLEAPSYNLSI